MKKIYALIIAALLVNLGQAQFSENFDSYTAGSYIGVLNANFTTWSGTTGGTEDAQINTVQSKSGSNSIYFKSTAVAGGPQDVVLTLGGLRSLGQFSYGHSMYISSGQGAYFNFQGDVVVGTTWVLNVQFLQNNTFTVTDGDNVVRFTGTYTSDTWFDFDVNVNLNTNTWEVLKDGVSIGSFVNPTNRVASVNFYPTNQTSGGGNNLAEFWIDDVSFNHTPYTLTARNAAVNNITFETPAISTTSVQSMVSVRNLGIQPITAFDVALTYNGQTVNQSVTGVSIASLGTYEVALSQATTIAASATSITATVSNVNGMGADLDPADDSKTVGFTPIVPAAGKIVIVEEGTGTWCGWCPRGTVAMDKLAKEYAGFAAGIAIHNGDPMVVSAYDAGIGNLISGYPSALVNRNGDIDPADIFNPVLASMEIAPSAILKNGAKFDAASNTLDVSVTVDFKKALTGDWRLVVVLTEDSVTGTAAGYAQANYYSSSSSNRDLIGLDGVNWRNLSNPVPANQSKYDHVARAIAPSFGGDANSFPATIGINTQFALNYSFTMDAGWKSEDMHIVSMLIAPDGKIDNGGNASFNKAISNGFVPAGSVSLAEYLEGPDEVLTIFPNPSAAGYADVFVNNVAHNANVQVLDIQGKVIFETEVKTAVNGQVIRVATDTYAKGIYLVKATFGAITKTKKLVVE